MITTEVIAKTLLLDEQGQALVLWRADDDENRPGEIDIPGGGVKLGETILDGAVREVREETAITVAPLNLRRLYTDVRPNRTGTCSLVRMLFSATKYEGGIELSTEHSAYGRADPLDLAERLNHPVWSMAIRDVVERRVLYPYSKDLERKSTRLGV